MAEYILPAFIFITSLFILWILIKPSERLLAILCLIGSGFITYLISTVSKSSPDNSTAILSISFIIELVVLILLVLAQKKDINVKVISIFYSIVIIIAFLSARGCYNSDKKWKDRQIEKDNEISAFKNKYDFNVDSLLLRSSNSINVKKVKLKLPIIVYRKWEDKTSFDYEFNKSLERNLTTLSYDSLNTVIILENTVVDIGTYSNGKTKAQKIETTIRFLDKQSMKEITSTTLTGGEPPSSISYRRSSPESRSGSAPTSYEIIETIKNELLSQEK
jgi:hypothetical protein